MDLHVDVTFGYVNFVERVGEGGIETIEHLVLEIRQNSRRSSFLAKFRGTSHSSPTSHSDGSISIKETELWTKSWSDKFQSAGF